MFTNLTRRETPAIIIEYGGGGAMPEEHLDDVVAAIEWIVRAMEILPGGDVRQPRYRNIGACDLVFSTAGGFFEPACMAGDSIGAGAPVGRVIDTYGRERARVLAGQSGFVAVIAARS